MPKTRRLHGLFLTLCTVCLLSFTWTRDVYATQYILDSVGIRDFLGINSGNSPSIIFSQDTSGGALPYGWGIAANQGGIAINDITSGTFPFSISAGAPNGSFFIDANGRIGLGTFTPGGNLHIFGQANQDVFNGVGPDPVNGPALNFGYSGNSFGRGSGFFNVRADPFATPPNPAIFFATANVPRMVITNTGQVGIGILPSQALDVFGNIRASGGFISGGSFLNVPDYVFEPDYKLLPLPALASYVEKEKHLPDIPSALEIKEQGVNMSELQMQLLKKVEELTLYTLQQEKTITELTSAKQQQKQTITELSDALAEVRARLAVLEQSHH